VEWLHVAVYSAVMFSIGAGMLIASQVLGPRKLKKEGKFDPYECGVPLVSSNRERFSVRFYLVAIMFILFDIETVFLIPWAVLHRELGVFGLAEVGIFLFVLGFGLLYLWKRGGLEWE